MGCVQGFVVDKESVPPPVAAVILCCGAASLTLARSTTSSVPDSESDIVPRLGGMKRPLAYLIVLSWWAVLTPRGLAAQAEAPPTIETLPAVTIGGYDERPGYLFSEIGFGTVVANDRIALVDRSSQEVRVFDREGVHMLTFGGKGEGPGEFRQIAGLDPVGDTRLAVWGFRSIRLSIFDSLGELEHTTSMTMPPVHLLWTWFVGSFSDGSFVLRSNPNEMLMQADPPGPRIDPTTFVHYSPEGK